MMKQINVIFTSNNYEHNNALKGYYRKDFLDINFSKLPEEIYIFIDALISANNAENCMRQLREKLCDCEELIAKGKVMKYHNHNPSYRCIGGLNNDSLDEGIEEKCFKTIHFSIAYSLHDLN